MCITQQKHFAIHIDFIIKKVFVCNTDLIGFISPLISEVYTFNVR